MFHWFEEEVVNERRMADLNPEWAVIGKSAKTDGNCTYDRCVIDKTKHNLVRFVDQENLGIHVQNPLLKLIDELNHTTYEVTKSKK